MNGTVKPSLPSATPTHPHPHSTPTKRLKQRKVLLMGKSGAGKSSMRSIVFSNYVASDVRRLGATIDVEHSNIRFMGNLTLNLWDCGGQDGFMENYLNRQREHVFGNVAALIYVFDVESREFAADLVGYGRVVRALEEFTGPGGHAYSKASKDRDKDKDKDAVKEKEPCRIWVLLHKMDLVDPDLRERIFRDRTAAIRKATFDHAPAFASAENPALLAFFPTSIWDQSLYAAWTKVIYHLIPNAAAIESLLARLCAATNARECVLYERTTCLTVARSTLGTETLNPALGRFEALAAVLKTHRQSLARHTRLPAPSANFDECQIKTPRFSMFVTRLTENTNLAVVLRPGEAGFNAARANVVLARPKFMELDAPAASTGNGAGGGKGGRGGGFWESAARDLGYEERERTGRVGAGAGVER